MIIIEKKEERRARKIIYFSERMNLKCLLRWEKKLFFFIHYQEKLFLLLFFIIWHKQTIKKSFEIYQGKFINIYVYKYNANAISKLSCFIPFHLKYQMYTSFKTIRDKQKKNNKNKQNYMKNSITKTTFRHK